MGYLIVSSLQTSCLLYLMSIIIGAAKENTCRMTTTASNELWTAGRVFVLFSITLSVVKIIWSHTMPRMLLSMVLVICGFIWDSTFNQGFLSTYNLIGWFISGVLIYSIAENGYSLTNWGVFKKIKNSFSDNIKNETGVNINNQNQ